MRSLRSLVLLCGLYLCASACRQVLGIEDAETDPSLSRPTPAEGAGSMTGLESGGTPASGGTGADGTAAGRAGSGGDPALAAAGGKAGAAAEVGAGGAGGATDAPSVCERYCTAVMQNCTAAFAVYTSLDTCLAVCAALPEGMPGDRAGNSVQCRLHAASVARDEVPHYCPIAGPGGNGVCGSNCEDLCQLRDKLCADYKTSDTATCLQSCSKLKDLGTYSTDLSANQYGGPHVQCRLYHVSAAAVDDAELHCTHVDGAAPCK